jgi:hypothetical protein
VRPLHGKAILKIIVGVIVVVEIIIYIDPSGTVVDGNHENAPVWDASVTLLSSATEAGPYTAVENGSAVMSPMNRVNPDTSRANGAFGWEVIEGFYKVEATKTGCGTGATSAFAIPPPVENLVIVLHCEGEQWKLGEEGGEKMRRGCSRRKRQLRVHADQGPERGWHRMHDQEKGMRSEKSQQRRKMRKRTRKSGHETRIRSGSRMERQKIHQKVRGLTRARRRERRHSR